MAITIPAAVAAFYQPLSTIWNGSGAPPAGATGNSFAGPGDTTANKLAATNSWTVAGSTFNLCPTYRIYNAVVPADFQALTAANQQLVRDILGMGTVDPSPGTQIASVLASVFSGKATTLANLTALQASLKITQPWWQSVGLLWPVTQWDAVIAGLIGNPNPAPAPQYWNFAAANKRRLANFNVAVDIIYTPVDAGGNPISIIDANGNVMLFADAGFSGIAITDALVLARALRQIANVLLPNDAAISALTA